MIEITEQEFEDRKDYYCDKAESGTVVLVEKPDKEALKKYGVTKHHRKSFKLFDEQLTIDF